MCSTSMRNDDLRAEILTQYFEMLSPSMKLQKPFFSVDHANEISFQWISFSIEHKAPKSNNKFSQNRRIRAICHLVSRHVTIYLLSSKHVASHFTFPIRRLIISGTEIFYWNEKSWPRNSMKRRRRNVSEFMIMTVAVFHMF